MATILTRTTIIYLFISIALKVMGKRQIGEFEVGELVSTLLISEIAAIPICDANIPIAYAIIPIGFILSVEILSAALKTKFRFFKKIIEGKPVYIIYKGRLSQKALLDNRVSIDEILAEVRSQGVGDISEIDYAILEENGVLSVIRSNENTNYAHTLIVDGEINRENAKGLGISEEKLMSLCGDTNVKDIFLMTLDDGGKTNIILKERI